MDDGEKKKKKSRFVYLNMVSHRKKKILGRISACLLPFNESMFIGSMPSTTKIVQVKTVRKMLKRNSVL